LSNRPKAATNRHQHHFKSSILAACRGKLRAAPSTVQSTFTAWCPYSSRRGGDAPARGQVETSVRCSPMSHLGLRAHRSFERCANEHPKPRLCTNSRMRIARDQFDPSRCTPKPCSHTLVSGTDNRVQRQLRQPRLEIVHAGLCRGAGRRLSRPGNAAGFVEARAH
jgi:hypothetical protein